MSTPVIIHGAAGRMGQRLCTLALEQGLTLVAGVDRAPGSLRELGIASDAPLLEQLPVQPGVVVIDFSHPSASPAVARHCAQHAMPWVCGTTGLEPAQRYQLLAEVASSAPALWAANFSLGVNLLLAEAARVAAALGLDYDCEIVEAHHNRKVDAPSGTALALADSILIATGRSRDDLEHGREGQTGARRRGAVGMHALRMGDVVGDHEVYFVGNGERIRLGHVAHTRDVFVQGALRAASWLHGREAGIYGMADVLGR